MDMTRRERWEEEVRGWDLEDFGGLCWELNIGIFSEKSRKRRCFTRDRSKFRSVKIYGFFKCERQIGTKDFTSHRQEPTKPKAEIIVY